MKSNFPENFPKSFVTIDKTKESREKGKKGNY